MTMVFDERTSDSPYIENVTHGFTLGKGSPTRPSEIHWHMVFVKREGKTQFLVVGPLSSSGIVHYGEGAELLWLKLKLGTFMPHLPTNTLLDMETALPEANSSTFWLKGSAWQVPSYNNIETFVSRLAREEILVQDPLVNAVLRDEPHDFSARTVRHRFLRATGLPRSHILQFERAQQAAALLQQGCSILDTTYSLGYFDQPHLTRSLKKFLGRTPAQYLTVSADAP